MRLQGAGQPVVVEDRPGASSIIGTDAVAKRAPDGYTRLMMSNTQTVNETLIPNKPYQLMRDFVPVAPVNYSDLVLVVHPSVGANSVADLIRIAKASPGKLNYASSGGTPYHAAGELFKAMAGVDIVHVPYKGSSGARTDVLGGQVQMMFDAVPTMSEHAKSGRVKALGTTGKTRSSVLPNIPTLDEAGVAGYEAVIWLGIMAPKSTPPAIVSKRNAEITKIQNRSDVRQEWASQGALPMPMTPDEFGRYLNADVVKWERIVKISRSEGRPVTLPQRGGTRCNSCPAAPRRASSGQSKKTFALPPARRCGHVRRRRRDARQAHRPGTVRRDHLTAPLIAALEATGHVRRAPPRRSGACGQGRRTRRRIAARDRRRPALRATPCAAGLYFPDPELATAGIHFVKVLRELGIHDAVAPRLHPFRTARRHARAARSTAPGLVGCTQSPRFDTRRASSWPARFRRLRTFDGLHGRSVQQRGGARAGEAPRRNAVGPGDALAARGRRIRMTEGAERQPSARSGPRAGANRVVK